MLGPTAAGVSPSHPSPSPHAAAAAAAAAAGPHAAAASTSVQLPHFSVRARDGTARAGTLHTASGAVLPTPLSLIYTRRGTPPTLTPDMIQRLKPTPTAYQINVLHFLTGPTPETLALFGKGARSFLGLESADLLVAGNRDPGQYEYGGKPSSDKALYCTMHAGGRTVTPEQYMEAVAALSPDLYVTMCDEVTADCKIKAAKASVTRTTAWMNACLEIQKTRDLAARPLIAITGGAFADERRRSAESAAARATATASAATATAAIATAATAAPATAAPAAAAPPALSSAPAPSVSLGAAPSRLPPPAGTEAAVAGFMLCGFGTGEDPTGDAHQQGEHAATPEQIQPEASPREPAAGLTVLEPSTAAGAGPLEEAPAATTAGPMKADADAAAPGGPRRGGGGGGGAALQGTGGGGRHAVAAVSGRPALLRACLGPLPPDLPRFISGVCSPSEVLDAVAEGVDVFDNSYVAAITAGGYALSFPLAHPDPISSSGPDASSSQRQQRCDASSSQPDDDGSDPCKLNLWSVAYRLDKQPLLSGCLCFTCTHHSRAYVHHLLQVHEMLAEVLLEMHNTHHYLAFMAKVGRAIEGGTFQQYRAWFKARLGPGDDSAVGAAAVAAAGSKEGHTEANPAALGARARADAVQAAQGETRGGKQPEAKRARREAA